MASQANVVREGFPSDLLDLDAVLVTPAHFLPNGCDARRRAAPRPAAVGRAPARARWQGAAAGLHLHVVLPPDVDERALTLAAYERGALVEDGAWHWARPEQAPPSLVIGYGAVAESAVRRGVAAIADALATTRGRR